MLSEHLGESPDDMEAHLALAQAFKGNCQINEAIAQYRYTLANSGNNPTVRSQCVKDLQDMKVIPSVAADTQEQKHNVNLKHKGQQLRRGSLANKKESKKTQPIGNDALDLQPIDPAAALAPVIKEPPVAPSFKAPNPDAAPSTTTTSMPPTNTPSTSQEPF